MKTELKPTQPTNTVTTLGDHVRAVAHKVLAPIGFGPVKARGQLQIPSNGLPIAQAAAIHGAGFGFKRSAGVAALTALALFFGGAVNAQARGEAGRCEPSEITSIAPTDEAVARDALAAVERQLASPGSFSWGRAELGTAPGRPTDASIAAAFTALEKIIEGPTTDPVAKAVALSQRGDLSLLAASLELNGQGRYLGLSEATLKEQGYGDLKEAIAILGTVTGDDDHKALSAIGRAVGRDNVLTPSEEQLLQAAVGGVKGHDTDGAHWVLGTGLNNVFVSDNRPDLIRYVSEMRERFADVVETNKSRPAKADRMLSALLGELDQAQKAGGAKGLVAAQITFSAIFEHGGSHALDEVMARVRGSGTGPERDRAMIRLGLYIMERAEPYQLAMHSTIPDRLMGPLENSGNRADLVSVARTYLAGFDSGPVPTRFHMVMLRQSLPAISKYDPASAKAAAEQFVRQAEAQIKAEPSSADTYRRGVGGMISSGLSQGRLTPEASGVLQAFYERLPPAS